MLLCLSFLDEDAVEIRLLCDHREVLVHERTRLINRLRINLMILDPELEATIPARKLDYPGQLPLPPAAPPTVNVRHNPVRGSRQCRDFGTLSEVKA
jgi:hypothetical protein